MGRLQGGGASGGPARVASATKRSWSRVRRGTGATGCGAGPDFSGRPPVNPECRLATPASLRRAAQARVAGSRAMPRLSGRARCSSCTIRRLMPSWRSCAAKSASAQPGRAGHSAPGSKRSSPETSSTGPAASTGLELAVEQAERADGLLDGDGVRHVGQDPNRARGGTMKVWCAPVLTRTAPLTDSTSWPQAWWWDRVLVVPVQHRVLPPHRPFCRGLELGRVGGRVAGAQPVDVGWRNSQTVVESS